MDDVELHQRINELVAEEHKLERAHIGQGLSEAEKARLTSLGVELDRHWDLLRQRDARRNAGFDPDTAQERGEKTVEGYQQ